MKALTEIQPWGTAILKYGKGIENRDWSPPDWLLRQRIAIHAGKKFDEDALLDLQRLMGLAITRAECAQGAIVGTVELAGYVDTRNTINSRGLSHMKIAEALASDWRSEGAKFLWVLRAPRVLAEPIPWRGERGLWDVPAEIVARVEDAKEVA